MKTAEEFKGTKGVWEVLFIEFENYDILCVARRHSYFPTNIWRKGNRRNESQC